MYSAAVVIASDRAASGIRPDACLPVFRELLESSRLHLEMERIVSDDPSELRACLRGLLEQSVDIIFTCGGTGCGPRDNTPEVIAELLDKATPGVDEAIRRFSASKSLFAMYSRGVSGISGSTLIISLPGSPKAVGEILGFLLPTIHHPLKLIHREIADCNEEVRSAKLR